MSVVRFGALGAARIAPKAVVEPARKNARCEMVAVAARDPARAAEFAREHGIPATCGSYAELVRRPDIDAVYVGLPASHHAHWSIEALRAGKHVLCEKPFATGADEAERMVAAAEERGLVLCEAFHYRYHPMAARVIELCRSGAIGALQRIESRFNAPIGNLADIRYDPSLGGGATMDLGCYPLHQMRVATGAEPEVVRARASERPAGIDEAMHAELRFPGGVGAVMDCSMSKDDPFAVTFDVWGRAGELHAVRLIAPHIAGELRWRDADGEHVETAAADTTTYDYQLEAFVAAVLDGAALPTGGRDAVETLRAIDAIYAAAGLPARTGLATRSFA